ncbi:TRAF3-interacting protein 1-like isoform X3 [Littorina saxatilis]|uniref:TRAF3-interacting protein 1 n=1 Tax=Littorina saxatilis TaxID=31220 RepID=A0AAN9ASV4_9CAEN
MDPKVVKKTQDTLGKIIKKPPLTEKLLSKPPFRFLHDIVTSAIKTTGFMKGLYSDAELNSENVKEKEGKIAFLQKAIDMVAAATGRSVSAKPAKIVAGHEPEKTNEFLQALGAAISANVDNDECVKKVLSGGGGEPKKEQGRDKEEKPEKAKERTRSASRKKDDDKHKKEDKEKSHDRDEDRKKRHHKDRDGDEHEEKEKDRHRDRREKSRDREDRHRDKDRDREKDKERRKRKEVEEKENESPEQNGEKEGSHDAPARMQRPTSAKGSRRRRQDDDEFQHNSHEPAITENDLPPQIANARKMARPPSARPAPPRPKQDGVEAEPSMRLGTGAPTNLIVDDGKDEDEDENFLVEESAPPPPVVEPTTTQGEPEDDAEHGALVKKMLESKKEVEQQQQPTKKTEIERPAMSDAQRRKQRELIAKEIERLQTSIQSLTRSANPLGKIMDYVQEDMDSMQKELDRWRSENKQHALDLKRERNVTDRAIEPLKAQLTEVERGITDQLDLIAASKANIIRNDQRIQKMLQSIAHS